MDDKIKKLFLNGQVQKSFDSFTEMFNDHSQQANISSKDLYQLYEVGIKHYPQEQSKLLEILSNSK